MYQNIRPKTEQDRVVEILMKLSKSDRNELLGYIQSNLMQRHYGLAELESRLKDDGYDYAAEDEDFDVPGANDDSGWKQVHGDVFRMPPMLSLLCAAVGNGLQLSLLCIICIVMAILKHLYAGRGSTVTVFIVFYALTSVVGGFVSGSLYAQASGPSWQRAMFLSATLFPGLVLGISFLVNFVSWHYETLHAIPFGTMVVVLLIWVCVSIPLTTAGTIVGRNWCGEPNHPCRVNPIPRYIPGNPLRRGPSCSAKPASRPSP